jgi:hypothetical protein
MLLKTKCVYELVLAHNFPAQYTIFCQCCSSISMYKAEHLQQFAKIHLANIVI